ncbi:MAG: hypothetical protein FVQ82_09315 [Planctomycetes bacterium]|nr:hypothetical protein [Planctomycetota bacterium]
MKMSPEKMSVHGNTSRQMPQVTGKTIIAGGLVLMLVFMWIRVFIGGSDSPDEADASVFAANGGKSHNTVMKLKRLPLPFEFGRHDRLTTDMFASRDMEIGKDGSSKGGKDKDKKIKSQKDAAGKLANKLELDAIILGTDKFSHKAFINGKLQVAGDKLEVKLNDKKYELVVVEVYHNKVVLKWSEYTITVRMAKLDNVK